MNPIFYLALRANEMGTKRVAIIDLGTNTFHLMIAEIRGHQFTIVSKDRVAVKIGMGGINDDRILDDGIERAMAAMRTFKRKLDEHPVDSVTAVGTSALRKATNGRDVAARLEKECGIPVQIISGDEEAGYIYQAVREAVPMKDEVSLIIDIGGGSIEFIIGNDKSLFWKKSFEIGAQRLLERFQKHDPIRDIEIEQLDNYLSDSLKPLFKEMDKYSSLQMIGTSGTFDTLSEMYCLHTRISYSENFPETPLTISSFSKIFRSLKEKNREQRLQMPGMIEMRVDMIVVACCVIDFLLRRHAFSNVRVSTWSLKEGVLASLASPL